MGQVGLESHPRTCCFLPLTGSNLNQVSFFLPVYKIPSELLHGDDATNWGIVKGNFFSGSRLFPNKYSEPSRGSGKKIGIIAFVVSTGT